MPIYHLERGAGSDPSAEAGELLQRRFAERGIPLFEASTIHVWAAYMRWLGRPIILNGPDWGLASLVLEERAIAPACNTPS
jgi:hypothetical protein